MLLGNMVRNVKIVQFTDLIYLITDREDLYLDLDFFELEVNLTKTGESD